MDASATRITADDYYAIAVEGDRKQLVDGAIVVNEPKLSHGVLQLRIGSALQVWVDSGTARGLACTPTDVAMDEYNVYAPDVIWIAERHLPPDLDRYPSRVPDVCVEIRSPSTWRHDIGTKKRIYELGQLPELWLVDDVARTVFVFRRSRPDAPEFDVALELMSGDAITSPQLPGFALAIDQLFLTR